MPRRSAWPPPASRSGPATALSLQPRQIVRIGVAGRSIHGAGHRRLLAPNRLPIRPRLPLTYGSSSPVRLASPQCPPGRWSARCAESGSTSVPTERVRAEVQAPEAGACVLHPGRARLLDLVWGHRPASAAPPLICSPILVPYFLILRLLRAFAPFPMRNLRVVPPASGAYNRRRRNWKIHRREVCP